MTTITLPPDLEARLAEAAQCAGVSVDALVVSELRRLYRPAPAAGTPSKGTLYDALAPFIGVVSVDTGPVAEESERRFADLLAEDHARRSTP